MVFDVIVGAVGFLSVCFALFLLFRAYVLWYFKINRAVALLESIDRSLQQLPAVREARMRQAQLRAKPG